MNSSSAVTRPVTSLEVLARLARRLLRLRDEKAELKRYTDVCTTIVEALADVLGLRAVVEHDPVNCVIPHAVVYFTPEWVGPSGHAVRVALPAGQPHVYVQQGAHQSGYGDKIRRSDQAAAWRRDQSSPPPARGADPALARYGG
jgi:hypothetical protein